MSHIFDFCSALDSPELNLSTASAALLPARVGADFTDANAMAAVSVRKDESLRGKCKHESLRGKCGSGRWGGRLSKLMLAYHMRTFKKLKQVSLMNDTFEQALKAAKTFGRHKYNLDLHVKRLQCTVKLKKTKFGLGNRFKRGYPSSWYVVSAFRKTTFPGVSLKAGNHFQLFHFVSCLCPGQLICVPFAVSHLFLYKRLIRTAQP
jgi:hypothetical protein